MTDPFFLKQMLGGMSVSTFLRRHWQRRPLYIRQALDPADLLVSRDDLFHLVSSPNVESRLVQYGRGQWRLSHGPFNRLPSAKKDWTVLVQSVNCHHDGANDLLRKFRFLPQARLDDLMISYAVTGGGVGPHFDSYDVFLLQGHGRRRWRISAQSDLSLKADLPLKILDHFVPEQEFICQPGDLLYLPPGYAHEGVALEPCMTYSIGFRAPSHQEWITQFYLQWIEHLDLSGHYTDRNPKFLQQQPAAIPDQMLKSLKELIEKTPPSHTDLCLFLGEYLTEPKPNTCFQAKKIRLQVFENKIRRHGLQLDKQSLMLYHGPYLFLNGESFLNTAQQRKILERLANQTWLKSEQCLKLGDILTKQCHDWYQKGWLQLHTKIA
jgi:50S ribosomal protein L16 3-hydroxylase